MKYEEFVERMKNELEKKLKAIDEKNEVEVQTIEKMNMKYEAFTFKVEGVSCTPIIDAKMFYEDAGQCDDFENEADMLIDTVMNGAKRIAGIEEFAKCGYNKENVYMKVHNAKGNEKMMENSPHVKIEDLVLTFHYLVGEDGDGGIMSAPIVNGLVESFGVDADTIIKDGMENSSKLFPKAIYPLGEDGEMIVVSNEFGSFGAASMFYEGVMNGVSEMIGGDFYAIPSSVHEFIAIPTWVMDIEKIDEMIKEGNEIILDECDVLSDHAYLYSREDDSFKAVYC